MSRAATIRWKIASEKDLERVEAWLQRLSRSESWADLLGPAA